MGTRPRRNGVCSRDSLFAFLLIAIIFNIGHTGWKDCVPFLRKKMTAGIAIFCAQTNFALFFTFFALLFHFKVASLFFLKGYDKMNLPKRREKEETI